MEIAGITTRMMQDYLLSLLDQAEKQKKELESQIHKEIFDDQSKVAQLKKLKADQQIIRVLMVCTERMETIERLTSDYALLEDEFPFIEKHLRSEPL